MKTKKVNDCFNKSLTKFQYVHNKSKLYLEDEDSTPN